MIASASSAAIDRQGAIEDWLAHYLASTWPRSGPLVEDAVQSFGWDRVEGRIDESAPVAFLNARLRALAFLDRLAQPDHRLHKAYVELRKPGPRSKLPWQSAKISDVNELLVTIREQYPELEEYLDGPRVASYREPDEVANPWKWVGIGLFAMFAVGRILMEVSPDRPRSDAPPVVSYQSAAWSQEDKQTLLDDLFGPGVSYGSLASEAPGLYTMLSGLDSSTPLDFAREVGRNTLRRSALNAAAHAPFADLVAIQSHKLSLLRWLRDNEGADACGQLDQWVSGNDAFKGDADIVEADRALARRLLDAGLLRENDTEFPRQAEIPGSVVQAVMDKTGMSEETFAQVAMGTGPAATKCAYRIAMLEEILRRPGDVSADLLRIS